MRELVTFLKPLNAEAHQSLNVPNTLHRNLLSTNTIENSFRNTRRKLDRMTHFRAKTDQATRWLAYALTEVVKGFRRIRGSDGLDKLIAALKKQKNLHQKNPSRDYHWVNPNERDAYKPLAAGLTSARRAVSLAAQVISSYLFFQ